MDMYIPISIPIPISIEKIKYYSYSYPYTVKVEIPRQLADLFTKPLARDRFNNLRIELLILDMKNMLYNLLAFQSYNYMCYFGLKS